MIREATAATLGAELVDGAEAVWRQTSGAAHGFTWPLLGDPSTAVNAPDEDGMAEMVAAASVDRFANAYMLAFQLTQAGFRLRRDRGRT